MTPRLVCGLLLSAVATAGCKGTDGPVPPISTCTYDWVVPTNDPVYADSLPVDAPKLVWGLTLDGGLNDYGTGPVLAGDRLVLATGRHLFFVTKDGMQSEDMAGERSVLDGPWSPPTADTDGNVYLVGWDGVRSLTSAGNQRWHGMGGCSSRTGGGELPGGTAMAYQCAAAVLSSDGKLFTGASGDEVYALDSRSGHVLWSTPIHANRAGYMSHFYGGGGNQLLLYIADRGDVLLDATSGKTISPMNLWCGASNVGTLGWMVGFECTGGVERFDTCHFAATPNVTGERRAFATLTAPGERLVTYDYGVDANGYETGPSYITLYNRDGSVAVGPVSANGVPFAVGADGTVYAFTCNGPTVRYVAYSRDLQQLWLLDLPSTCYSWWWLGGAVLDGDGMLYVSQEGEIYGTTNLFAIQTRSPGLANSSWPHWRHDNRGTGWLGQPVQDRPAIDAGALDAEQAVVDSGQ